MDALIRLSAQLREIDTSREEKMRERDVLIRQARDEGHTWIEIGRTTGLSPRAISLSLKRSE